MEAVALAVKASEKDKQRNKHIIGIHVNVLYEYRAYSKSMFYKIKLGNAACIILKLDVALPLNSSTTTSAVSFI